MTTILHIQVTRKVMYLLGYIYRQLITFIPVLPYVKPYLAKILPYHRTLPKSWNTSTQMLHRLLWNNYADYYKILLPCIIIDVDGDFVRIFIFLSKRLFMKPTFTES